MMIGNNVSYIKAYTEVSCLLEYLPQSYIDKLPQKLIELIKKQSDKRYYINIDTNKSLLEQNFSPKTKRSFSGSALVWRVSSSLLPVLAPALQCFLRPVPP